MSWDKLEQAKTNWNHLERAGINQNGLERDAANKDQHQKELGQLVAAWKYKLTIKLTYRASKDQDRNFQANLQ